MSRINDSSYNNVIDIYAMSDIHGDLDLLIINLRDCAKVIRNRNDSNWRVYADIPIPNINLNDIINSDTYDCLFGFEWCGNKKWIIIIGDIIDNYRENYTLNDIKDNNKRQNEILHEELKIILFLNKLNKKAQQQGGNVIKLIGNHEDMNIHNIYNTRYISKYAITNNFYTIKREEIFRIHNKILNHIDYKHNSNKKYVIFKINDFIFVHGGLNQEIIKYFYSNITKENKDPSFYNYFKSFIKGKSINIDDFIDYINEEYNRCIKTSSTCKYINDNAGLLWYRGLGFHDIIYDKQFCNELDNIFARLCQNNVKCKQNKYLIIGHCIQSDFSLSNIKNNNNSHSNIKKYNNIHVIDGPIIETNIAKELYQSDISNKLPMLFGITASCVKSNNPNLASIYRVDIGASRAFDSDNYNKYFMSYIEPIYNELYSNIYNMVRDYNNEYKFTSKYVNSSLSIEKIIEKITIIINIYKKKNKINELLISKLVDAILLNNKKFKIKLMRYIYQYFISRLPQLLHIKYNNNQPNTEIIRSTLENTIINMARNNIYIFNNKKYYNIINKIIKEIDN
jgi:hypothetical protein